MGKARHNAKARQVVKTNIDNSQTSEIKLEFGKTDYGASDASNLLALPSKKRKSNIIKEKKEKTRFLSKAQRKKLEKIVEKKKKKESRAALLESLSQVQASPDEVKQLTAISAVQTIGLRKLNEFNTEVTVKQDTQIDEHKKFSSIAGAKKRLRLLRLENSEKVKKKKYDPNVVGLEESTDDESESSSDEDDGEEVVNNEVNGNEEVSAKKRLRLLRLENSEKVKKKKYDPNVVGLEESTDDDESESSPDEDDDEEVVNGEVNENEEVSTNDVEIIENLPETTENETKTAEKEAPIEEKPVIVVKEQKKALLEHPTVHIDVKRDPKIQVARLKLPILGEEQRIMELVNENEFVIVAGETGAEHRGNTHKKNTVELITSFPQFLYEAGYAERKMIAVTEPRRVATVAMSARVGHELGLTSKEVSYLMRFEGNVTKDTKIKFMTDGVLLKEIQTDFLLSKYSVVIIDEAHERSVYTDILLGLLSRIVPLRRKRGNPLRLIIMSATLRVEDFTENKRLFKEPPPLIKIDSRQFPVTIHFNKHTYNDYLKEAYKKAVKIHTRLPEGGILIFVTGQQEVRYLVRKLKASFPYRKDVDYSKVIAKKSVGEVDTALDSEPEDIESDDDEVEKEMKRARKERRKAKIKAKSLPKINLDDYEMPEDDGQADLVGNEDDSDGHLSDSDNEDAILEPEIRSCRQPLWVLPLYSMLSSSKQARVFAAPPVGARLCVVTTDVAETSLTIPQIKYVVDTGKKKMRVYDHITGASAWRVVWTSQASAAQRAGRAGRTAAGHAYRLYSSAVFSHDLPEQHEPDLARRPADDVVLLMKCMGIDKVVNFPFPTAPDRLQLRLAEKRLQVLGILEEPPNKSKRNDDEQVLKVTSLGKAVSAFPLLPRYGKMLALSHQQHLLPYAIALVAALTVPEVMNGKADCWPATGQTLLLGDPGVLLRAVGAAEFAHFNGEEDLFCAKHGLREKAVKEIRKLRKQLTSEINLSVSGVDVTIDPGMKPPDENQARLLRQLVLSGLGDQVGKKIALDEVKEGEDKRKFKYAYHCAELEEPVHLHSESILRQCIPEWVVYQELYETGTEARRKMVMRNVTAIEPEWLPVYVPQLCNLGEDKRKFKYAYHCAELEEPVHLHSESILRQCIPEWVVYQELYETGTEARRKMVMRNVTAIEPEWLPVYVPQLCNLGEPLPDTEPRYEESSGRVRCSFKGTFGKACWELPVVEIDYPDKIERYRWFARFLLEGVVFPKLKKYTSSLLSPPSTMVKSWAKLQPRTELLLRALIMHRAGTRQQLIDVWEDNPKYLLDEYMKWLPESAHNEVTLYWPPI
ncbi:putative ATP-dependent RNA helicase kurz [Papilio machaon]|uniref:RNA helicase n=1 Tax=Papilio machaon TaxID=76193 RepID=A0A194R1L0_PAPMA|nr:putative ATP-dependent RNA helicase kurz [Papilio machaon]